MIKLEILNPEQHGKKLALTGELTIGSAPNCTIKANSPKMKDVHARFFPGEGDRYFVEVVNQEAHIFLNGRDILRSELRHQDLLTIGPLQFRVIDESFKAKAQNRLNQLLENLETGAETVYDFAKEDLFYLANKDPALAARIAFTIPSKDRFMDQAQQFLARLIHKSGMDEMKVESFMTCAKELILNAHRHGHDYDETKTITLRYRDCGETVQLSIEDQGKGFDHAKVLGEMRSMNAAEAARKRAQAGGYGGLGFQMILRMADRLEYNEKGNVVTFSVNKKFD